MKGKVIIITGASSGIGKACAFLFAKMGGNVILVARNEEKLTEIEEQIISKGGSAISIKCDVSSEVDCKEMIKKTIDRFDRVDVLINNAGISMRAVFNKSKVDVIKQVMDINFWGAVYCTKYALPYILKSKGSVVGVSSIAGYIGLPARTGYSASKYAMQGFLEALRTENLNTGLHVLIVCPGFTASNIRNTALLSDGTSQGESPREEQKMMSAEEVADHIYNGVMKRKRTIILTTEGKLVVFLRRFFPRLLERLVFNKMLKEPNSPLQEVVG